MLDLNWSQIRTIPIGNLLAPVGCVPDGTFSIYFRQNMNKMGIYVPDNTLATVGGVFAVILTMAGGIKKYGVKVSMKEILTTVPSKKANHWAENLSEYLLETTPAGASIYASYALGAMVGSTIHAMININGCGVKAPSFRHEVDKFSDRFFIRDPAIKRYILNDPQVLNAVVKLGFVS